MAKRFKYHTDNSGTKWRVVPCDYRHKGKTKSRFVLREVKGTRNRPTGRFKFSDTEPKAV